LKQATRKIKKNILSNKKPRIAIVVSRFNPEVCEGLLEGAVDALKEVGLAQADIDIFRVPGAFEIPLTLKKCAATKRYAGLIALGAVIRGDTPHFDYVCRAATDGIGSVALDSGLPTAFGLLTTDNLEQAKARSASNDFNKGRESAVTVLEMIDLLKRIKHG